MTNTRWIDPTFLARPEVKKAIDIAAELADHLKQHDLQGAQIHGLRIVEGNECIISWDDLERTLRNFSSVSNARAPNPTIYGTLNEFLSALGTASGRYLGSAKST